MSPELLMENPNVNLKLVRREQGLARNVNYYNN